MPGSEHPLQGLADFIPKGSFELVEPFLIHYKVHLTITRSRSTVLGDYRNAHAGKTHRISVNGNLNPYAFLITLLHELAHLITYVRFGNRVSAHGTEWKAEFAALLTQFLSSSFFPDDVRSQLLKSLKNPAASSCADDALMRVLRKYDLKKEGFFMVEELMPGDLFLIKNGRVFRREERLRKRIRAVEVQTGKVYLFSPVYEVRKQLL